MARQHTLTYRVDNTEGLAFMGMTVRLERFESGSAITLISDKRHLGSIAYTQRSHKYRSESDYETLATELNTYGERALIETFTYLTGARRQAAYAA